MKKLSLLLLLCTFSVLAHSQSYVNPSFSYYNGEGKFKDKAMASLEVGAVVNDVLSLGVAGGVLDFQEYTPYVEFRPSVTVFTYDRVSVSATLGAGYVFRKQENLLVELAGTLAYSLGSNTSLSVFAGQYRFNGNHSSSTATFIGTGLSISLK